VTGLAVLCPGQGDQHASMFALSLTREAGRAVLERAREALGEDPLALLGRGGQGLYQNRVAQPLVCSAELASWATLEDSLPRPSLFLGYSLGELVAYGCAGALAPGEAIRLAAARAEAMEAASATRGGLLALRGLPLARAESLAARLGAEVAIANGPEHCVVGGSEEALAALERLAPAEGARTVVRLPIGVPAHTRLLAAAVGPFAAALRRSGLEDPRVPVLAGVSAEPVRRREEAVDTLSRQLAERIEWARCLAAAAEMGCKAFLELGPGTALARMAREILPGSEARSLDEFRSREGVLRWAESALRR